MSSKRHSRTTRAPSRRPLSSVLNRHSNTTIRSRMFSVAVQPPSQAQVGASIYPPVIVRGRPSSTAQTDGQHTFAMAVLRDAEGNVLTDSLMGTATAAGIYLPDGRSNSTGGGSLAFMFSDLAVPYSGSYSIRIDVYRIDYEDPQGAVLMDQTDTRGFTVYDCEVPVPYPSSDEASVMRKLRDQGYAVPGLA